MSTTRIDLGEVFPVPDERDVTAFEEHMTALTPGSFIVSGHWDDYREPVIEKAAPIVLRLQPGKAFRATGRTVTRFTDDGTGWVDVNLSEADRDRLHRYMHPETYARRSRMHAAYRRRHS